jgi:hypothetical protein
MSSNLQNKLFNYEVPPPPGSWEEIDAALGQQQSSLSNRLLHFEVNPPGRIWASINKELDQQDQASPVVPFTRRHRNAFRYAGVAAVLIAVAVLTSLLINKNTQRNLSDETLVDNPVDTKIPEQNDTGSSATVQTQEVRPRIIALPRKQQPSSPKPEKATAFAFTDPDQEGVETSTGQKEDKYMLFIDGDGNVMRLSKKLFNAFACAAYDYVCKERINSLQAKVASTAVSSNFTGILDILKNLQENQ